MKKKQIPTFPLLVVGYFVVLITTIVVVSNKCSSDNIPPSKANPKEKIKEKPSTKTLETKQLEAQNFKYLSNSFSAFVFDISKHDISFYYLAEDGQEYNNFANVKQASEEEGQKLLFATNAGIFTKENEPEGLFITDGKTEVPLNLQDGSGNFYLKPSGVFFIKKNGKMGILESKEYSNEEINAQYATQSGPLLLRNGVLHPAINQGSENRFIRNGVGIISSTKAVFLISNEPINFYDFSMTFKEKFNCQDALYLDGAISEMFLPSIDRMNQEGNFSGIIGVSIPL